MTDWDNTTAVAETPEIKLFGKWSTDDVQINDISLQVSIKTRVIYLFELFFFLREARVTPGHACVVLVCYRPRRENVFVYSLAVVCCGPVNHQLRYITFLNFLITVF